MRRNHRRQRRQLRRTPDDQAHLHPGLTDGRDGLGRQGHHVRLRRHQPQARRRHPRRDEERHVGSRRAARCDAHAARARLPNQRHRIPDVHRQHAVRVRPQDGRRPDRAQRQDRRGRQHRCRRPPGDDGRPRDGRRAEAGRHHRHRHPDRRQHARTGHPRGRRHGQRPTRRRPGPRRRAPQPTSAPGSSPWNAPTDLSSTATSPTSATLVDPTRERSPRDSFSRSLSMAPRGLTSTSPAPRWPIRPAGGGRAAARGSARACSPSSRSPSPGRAIGSDGQIRIGGQLDVRPQLVPERREPADQGTAHPVLAGHVPHAVRDDEVHLDVQPFTELGRSHDRLR